ncbi:Citrate synthase [Chitinispirillum alkaliphilum]|nr:Citrate synthase [Chitinispirillum alkaliphilum]
MNGTVRKESQFERQYLSKLCEIASGQNCIDPEMYCKYNVKRGLRNEDGTGVLVGLTHIGDVHGYIIDEGEKTPVEGRLRYRGINIKDIINGCRAEKRFGFSEVAYLLLFGELPQKDQLDKFREMLDSHRELPAGFTENMILKAPSSDIMNKLARSVLACYSYDEYPDDLSLKNNLRQCIELIARFPTLVAYAYQAKCHYFNKKSLVIHNPLEGLSTAENFLHMIRPDSKYTQIEAETLDFALMLHAEHGGGNNSAFALHVVSSADTDIYSAMAAAVGALKGGKHGGANIKVSEMMECVKNGVRDWKDDEEIASFLAKILKREEFDRKGLIYGMGHAIYTLSDPRAVVLKEKASELALEKGRTDEFELHEAVERVTPSVFSKYKGNGKVICANVDFYSGMVYQMLNIPQELYCPIFAISRIAGWSAHRIEELLSGGRIIRPAYKSVSEKRKYAPLNDR